MLTIGFTICYCIFDKNVLKCVEPYFRRNIETKHIWKRKGASRTVSNSRGSTSKCALGWLNMSLFLISYRSYTSVATCQSRSQAKHVLVLPVLTSFQSLNHVFGKALAII